MARGQQKKTQEPRKQETLKKNIKKEEPYSSEELVQKSESIQSQRQRRGRKKRIIEEIKTKKHFNLSQYPQKPSLIFPENLQNSLTNIIFSNGNFVRYSTILKHLKYFYQNEICVTTVNQFLAESEENGLIFELQGKYKITSELVNTEIVQIKKFNQNDQQQKDIKKQSNIKTQDEEYQNRK